MQTDRLSEPAICLLRRRIAGEWVVINEETQPIYRELVDTGIDGTAEFLCPGSGSRVPADGSRLQIPRRRSTATPAAFHLLKQFSRFVRSGPRGFRLHAISAQFVVSAILMFGQFMRNDPCAIAERFFARLFWFPIIPGSS